MKDPMTKKDREFNNFGMRYRGTGFIVNDGCYVLTARHVPNEFVVGTDMEGKSAIVPSLVEPTGAKVTMEVGASHQGPRAKITGTVIFSGPSTGSIVGDYALIRLDRRAAIRSIPVGNATDEELAGAPFITLGFPADRQVPGQALQMYADVNCKGLSISDKNDPRGVPTSCYGSPGDSGGPALAKVRIGKLDQWRVVGSVSQVNDKNDKIVGAAQPAREVLEKNEDIRITSFYHHGSILDRAIKRDLAKNPCQ